MIDTEILKFSSEDEMKAFFIKQEETDRWEVVYTKELETVAVPDNEILFHMGDNAFARTSERFGIPVAGFADDVDEEDIRSTMATTQMAVIVPGDHLQMYPLRYTAFPHIQKRAGVEGRSINNLERKRGQALALAPEKRCAFLNEGLSLYADRTNVLIRDGKVTAMMTGDENDYAVMPQIRLINIVENELAHQFAQHEFQSAEVNHEISFIKYSLHDDVLEKNLLNAVASTGMLASEVKVALHLITSDVGLSAARLTPVVTVDGVVLPMGKANAVEHKGGEKAMSAFIDMAHVFLAKYRQNAENLKALMDVEIKHPSDCLQHVFERLNLSGYAKALREAKEKLDQNFSSCTAFDIYYTLNEMVFDTDEAAKASGKEPNLYASIKAQESIAEVLFMDFKALDC